MRLRLSVQSSREMGCQLFESLFFFLASLEMDNFFNESFPLFFYLGPCFDLLATRINILRRPGRGRVRLTGPRRPRAKYSFP